MSVGNVHSCPEASTLTRTHGRSGIQQSGVVFGKSGNILIPKERANIVQDLHTVSVILSLWSKIGTQSK